MIIQSLFDYSLLKTTGTVSLTLLFSPLCSAGCHLGDLATAFSAASLSVGFDPNTAWMSDNEPSTSTVNSTRTVLDVPLASSAIGVSTLEFTHNAKSSSPPPWNVGCTSPADSLSLMFLSSQRSSRSRRKSSCLLRRSTRGYCGLPFSEAGTVL